MCLIFYSVINGWWKMDTENHMNNFEFEEQRKQNSLCEKVCRGDGPGKFKTSLKKQKIRTERRRAKVNPMCQAAYGRYSGYT